MIHKTIKDTTHKNSFDVAIKQYQNNTEIRIKLSQKKITKRTQGKPIQDCFLI